MAKNLCPTSATLHELTPWRNAPANELLWVYWDVDGRDRAGGDNKCRTFRSQQNAEWKKYPQNIRALQMVTEEILRPIFAAYSSEITNMDNLKYILGTIWSKNRTFKLWIECLIFFSFQ